MKRSDSSARSTCTTSSARKSSDAHAGPTPTSVSMDDDVYNRAKPIRLAIFDVDGVLTDGGLHYHDSGEETKVFDVRDGLGMKALQTSGVELAIITSRRSTCVARREENLGIELLFQGIEHKLTAFQELAASLGLEARHCAYMGDDWVD